MRGMGGDQDDGDFALTGYLQEVVELTLESAAVWPGFVGVEHLGTVDDDQANALVFVEEAVEEAAVFEGEGPADGGGVGGIIVGDNHLGEDEDAVGVSAGGEEAGAQDVAFVAGGDQ